MKVRTSKCKAPRFLASLWWVLTTWQCGYGQSGCCMSVLSWLHLSQWVKLHPLSIFSCTGAPKFLRNQQSSEYLAPKLALIGTWDLEKGCCPCSLPWHWNPTFMKKPNPMVKSILGPLSSRPSSDGYRENRDPCNRAPSSASDSKAPQLGVTGFVDLCPLVVVALLILVVVSNYFWGYVS